MRKSLKTFAIFLVNFSLIALSSCKVTEYVTEKEIEYVTELKEVEKTVTDTVYWEREVKESQEIEGNTFLPCPKDSTERGGYGSFKSGENYYKWKFDKNMNGYFIEMYLAKTKSVKDSIHEKKEIKEKEVEKKETIKEKETEKQIHTEKLSLNFWQKLWTNIYKFLFIIVLILWIFGVTPRFILKKIF